jgi:hypothetical protein
MKPTNEQADMAAMDMEMDNIGMEKEAAADDFFSVGAPKGTFTMRAMNGLVDAYNKALVAMGQKGDYPKFTADVTVFPANFVRGLAMLADAAEQAGVQADIDLSAVTEDRDVMVLAGLVERLSKDKAFAGKMKGPAAKGEPPPLDKGYNKQGGEENNLDALFMGRA